MPVRFLDDEKPKSRVRFLDGENAPVGGQIIPPSVMQSPEMVGMRQGAADVANLPGAAGGLIDTAQKWIANKMGNPDYNPDNPVANAVFPMGYLLRRMPSPEMVNRALFENQPEGPPPPDNTVDRYRRAAARGATGAAGMGGISPMALGTGVAASLGAEGASQIAPDSKWAPLVGGLATGATFAGGYNFLRPTAGGVAREMLRGVNNTRIQMGEDLQRSAMRQGLGPLTPGQALNNPGLLQVERLTEQSPQGGALREMYEQRGPAAYNVAREQIEGISQATPREGLQAVQRGAEGAIGELRQARAMTGGPAYQAAFDSVRPIGIDPAPIFNTIREIGDRNPAMRATLDRMATTVMRDRNGNPITDLEQLQNGIKMQLSTDIAAAVQSGDRPLVRALTETNDRLLTVLDNYAPQYAEARQLWARMSVPITEMEQGLVGRVLAQPDLSKAAKVFINPSNETPRDIQQAARALRRAEPEAVPVMVKQYLNDHLQATAKASKRDPSRLGGRFTEDVFGGLGLNTNQVRNIETAIQQLPEGQMRATAFRRMNDVFRAQARRLQAGSPTAPNLEIQRMLKEPSGAAGMVGRLVTGPMSTARDWLQNARLTGNYSELAEIFSSPNSIEQLRQLAREPNIRRAEIIVNGLLAGQRGTVGE